MFDLPEAKRVRREDLIDSDASSASGSEDDVQAREELEAQIARSLGIDVRVSQPQKSSSATQAPQKTSKEEDGGVAGDEDAHESEPEEFEFALFGGSAAPKTTKIVLEKDEGPKGEGGMTSSRPPTYYMAKTYSPEEKSNFAAAALSYEQLMLSSTRRHYADELPWKVTHVTTHLPSPPPSATQPDERKRRPGKKRRLAIKVKERKRKEKEEEKRRKKEAEKEREEHKEEFLKEKKKRLNRARKLKRREKAREERRARGEVVDEQDEEDSGSE